MRLFKALACWILLFSVPFTALSLGVGNIELDSALNEPFLADVPLENVGNANLNEITVELASSATFERYKLDKPEFLNDFVFTVTENRQGEPVVRITSRTPVSEPFVTFLMDIKWPSGRLLREYTVLLDPPVFDEAPVQTQVAVPATVAEPEPAPESAGTLNIEPVENSESVVEQAPVAAEPVMQPEADEPVQTDSPVAATEPADTSAGSYAASEGDTLWRIAERTRGSSGLTNNQMMLAIYRANPEAFIGNINALKAGSILRIPDAAEAAAVDVAEANAVAVEQHAEWSETGVPADRGIGLELVAPAEDFGSGTTADASQGSASGDPSEADGRVSLLESELEESQRLLQVRDAELQALQQRINELEQQDTAGEVVVEDLPIDEIAADDAVPADPLEEVMVDTVEEPIESPFADEAEELVDDSSAEVVADAEPVESPAEEVSGESSPGIVDLLLGYWMYAAGAIVLLAGLFLLRRRKATPDAEATGSWIAEVEADTDVTADETIADSEVDEAFATAGTYVEEAVETEDSSAAVPAEEDPFQASAEPPVADTSSEVDFDLPVSDEPEESLSGDDPLVDTDVSAADEIEISAPDQLEDELEEAAVVPESAVSDDVEGPLERTISTGAPLNLDQADPVAEAEFHMAYGLYDQAAELLVHALNEEPDNRAYRVKLIEVYFVWENKEGFLEQATALRESINDESDADWNKALILGKQICPESELFSGDASGGAVGDEMDLELGAADVTSGNLDFSLDADDSGAVDLSVTEQADADGGLDFDLGAAFDGDDESANDLGLDLGSLGDDQQTEQGPEDAYELSDHDQTQQIDDSITSGGDGVDLDVGASTMETPTMENPMVPDSGDDAGSLDIDIGDLEKTDAGMGIGAALERTLESPTLDAPPPGVDETAEMPNLDEEPASDPTSLDVDLSGLADFSFDDDGDAVADSATETPDIDSTLNQLDNTGEFLTAEDMSRTIAGESPVEEDADSTLNQLDNTGEFLTAEDMSRTIAGESPVEDDAAENDLNPLDDTGEMLIPLDEPGSDTVEQPDLTAEAEGDTAEQPEISDTLAEDLSGLLDDTGIPEDATMTEVGTKLDLARAYIDMGDPDGARSILNEVLDEGGNDQQQQARQLLEELDA